MDHACIARQTLQDLEERLERLQVLLVGDGELPTAQGSVTAQLRAIAGKLSRIEAQSSGVRQLLELDTATWRARERERARAWSGSEILEGQEMLAASVVLSHASRFKSMAAQLSRLSDSALSDSTVPTRLIAQSPRMLKAIEKSNVQGLEMAQLRLRSAALADRWYKTGVVGLGSAVDEWEDRLLTAEQSIRQRARQQQEDSVSA